MDEQKQTPRNLEPSSGTSPADSRKPWVTPSVRILPVPSATRSGVFAKKDQEDGYYKKS